MISEEKAKRIGSRQGLLFSGLGIFIAQLIMTCLVSSESGFIKGFFWFAEVEYKINLFVGGVVMLLCGYYYGQIAGRTIIIKNGNFVVIGVLTGMAVLLTSAFLSGWTGFFQEGIDNIRTEDNPFYDYIFKPFFWVVIFGIVPALIMGIWFGRNVKIRGRAQHTTPA